MRALAKRCGATVTCASLVVCACVLPEVASGTNPAVSTGTASPSAPAEMNVPSGDGPADSAATNSQPAPAQPSQGPASAETAGTVGAAGAGSASPADAPGGTGSKACVPGTTSCTFNHTRLCRADGQGFEMTAACEDGCDALGAGCLQCADSQHACFGRCFESNDRDHCGKNCEACPDFGMNGSSSCDGTECQVTCADTAISCMYEGRTKSCASQSIGFEEQISNVMVDGVSATHTHTGMYSLRLPSSGSYTFGLCGSGSGEADLTGKTVEVWVYAEPGDGEYQPSCRLLPISPDTELKVTLHEWTRISVSASKTATTPSGSVHVTCWPPDWTFYIDDMSIR